MPWTDFLGKAVAPARDGYSPLYPDGLRATAARGPALLWVHEIPPRVHQLRWIKEDSPVPFGPGATYRDVHLALPYLITLAMFHPDDSGRLVLSKRNECFFRNAPLTDWDDALFYPALLNTSKFSPQEGNPLSWICTQYIDTSYKREHDPLRRQRRGFAALQRCLLEAGFNYSSEHHEASSWFTESAHVDPRLATVAAWEEASAADPLFPLDVPWLPTGFSLRQVVDRIFDLQRAASPEVPDADAAAAIVFRHAPSRPGKAPSSPPETESQP
jgi:hypothetical protein